MTVCAICGKNSVSKKGIVCQPCREWNSRLIKDPLKKEKK